MGDTTITINRPAGAGTVKNTDGTTRIGAEETNKQKSKSDSGKLDIGDLFKGLLFFAVGAAAPFLVKNEILLGALTVLCPMLGIALFASNTDKTADKTQDKLEKEVADLKKQVAALEEKKEAADKPEANNTQKDQAATASADTKKQKDSDNDKPATFPGASLGTSVAA